MEIKLYRIMADNKHQSSFIEKYDSNKKESILSISRDWKWNPPSNYIPIEVELWKSDLGKKNYQFDFSDSLLPFLIFSENAITILKDILIPRGKILDILTESKRKKYFGYYPTNNYPQGILDLKKSNYKKYPNGLLIKKPVLVKDKIPDDYLFTIEEDISRIFVTDKFKKLVEENALVGFEFSEYNEIELS